MHKTLQEDPSAAELQGKATGSRVRLCPWTKEWEQLPGSQMGLWQDSGQRGWTATNIRVYRAKPPKNPWSRNQGRCLRLKEVVVENTSKALAGNQQGFFDLCLFWKLLKAKEVLELSVLAGLSDKHVCWEKIGVSKAEHSDSAWRPWTSQHFPQWDPQKAGSVGCSMTNIFARWKKFSMLLN